MKLSFENSRDRYILKLEAPTEKCPISGEYVPVDENGEILDDKKKWFNEGEKFPDDNWTWIPAVLDSQFYSVVHE